MTCREMLPGGHLCGKPGADYCEPHMHDRTMFHYCTTDENRREWLPLQMSPFTPFHRSEARTQGAS